MRRPCQRSSLRCTGRGRRSSVRPAGWSAPGRCATPAPGAGGEFPVRRRTERPHLGRRRVDRMTWVGRLRGVGLAALPGEQPGSRIQQRTLAHPGFAGQQQGATPTEPGRGGQSPDRLEFVLPSDEHPRSLGSGRCDQHPARLPGRPAGARSESAATWRVRRTTRSPGLSLPQRRPLGPATSRSARSDRCGPTSLAAPRVSGRSARRPGRPPAARASGAPHRPHRRRRPGAPRSGRPSSGPRARWARRGSGPAGGPTPSPRRAAPSGPNRSSRRRHA